MRSYNTYNKKNSFDGFTLLELLISMTILSIIVVIILGALRVGVRAWEKGEKDVDARQMQRIVLDLVRQQVSSINIRTIRKEGEEPFFLKGDAKSMEFTSRVSLNPENDYGDVYVKYTVRQEEKDKEKFLYLERNMLLVEKNIETFDVDDDDLHELISEVQNVSFEYLKNLSNVGENEWQESWEPENDKGLPLAVKMTLQENETTPSITMIVKIMSEQEAI